MEKIQGLSTCEAEASRERNGSNKLSEKKKTTLWKKYWEKFDDPIITILLIALGINIVFTFFGKVDWFECLGIFVSVMIATWVSALSEYKNEEAFRSIQREASKVLCKVYRDGALKEIGIDDIVKGDFVLLQAGDIIPADGFVFSGNIRTDQSALNGENEEVEKSEGCDSVVYRTGTVDFWDKSSLFRGAVVCSGQCVMKVMDVGDGTVYGKLSKEDEGAERESPLQLKLAQLAKGISRFGYMGAALVAAVYLFQRFFVDNGWSMPNMTVYFSDMAQVLSDTVNAIIMGVTVIVVSVPEGLPLMIAIVCSLNMKKMMKNNVLVRKLIGIETAGSINILFSDKTGTITCGRLEVVELVDGAGCTYKKKNELPKDIRRLMEISVLGNSTAQLSDGKAVGGNATEKALVEFAGREMMSNWKIEKGRETLFSSDKKFSQTEVRGDFCGSLVKGAPEIILPKCTRFVDKHGDLKSLEGRADLNGELDRMAKQSIRVLALATAESYSGERIPDNMTLVGLVGIRDDLRPDVKASVGQVKCAGIQVVMITGDKKETAVAIARDAGIMDGRDNVVLTSEELQRMTDEEIGSKLGDIRVIARALPTDKSRLVRIAQEKGLVVGMTGDGVNDLAALRRADVGFAMGSGTEVAKAAGDIVVLDDNFSSVRAAVLYGRTIYKSIRKFVVCQMTINIAAVLVSVIGPLIGMERPLGITQMLWINLIMDTLAAIAFGGEPALKQYMLEPPKRRDEKILDKKAWSGIIVNGMFICLASLYFFLSEHIYYGFRQHESEIYFYTGYFNFFVFAGVLNAFNARCEGIDLLDHISLNKPFLFIIGLICAVQIFITYFGGQVLRTAGLTSKEWLIVIIPALLIIPVDLLRKLIVKGK
ncbi:MAG: calcium-translocating P-type ATPase, PMCA-type [Ruminococcaceae bacterium]|nr:calcium-translocating P-type ATPase, PMCA-type [Oscillospiraceae bacterium]